MFILDIFKTPLGEMQGWEFILFLLLTAAAGFLSYIILKYLWIGLKFFCRGVRNVTSAKEKCKHIQCNKCGRTLDRCICERNKGKGSILRLAQYKREHKKR